MQYNLYICCAWALWEYFVVVRFSNRDVSSLMKAVWSKLVLAI